MGFIEGLKTLNPDFIINSSKYVETTKSLTSYPVSSRDEDHIVQIGFTLRRLNDEISEKLILCLGECDDVKQTLADVANYGADGGFGGLMFYYQTTKFYDDNAPLIKEALWNFAAGEGVPAAELVAGLRYLDATPGEVEYVLYDIPFDDDAETLIKNALAWWALEHVAYTEGVK